MMPIVIDVSAIVSLAFADEDRSYAEDVVGALAHDTGLVPTLFWFEMWNTLAMSERRGRSSPEGSKRFLNLLDQFGLVAEPIPAPDGILALSRKHQITAYDAAYLELALRTKSPLATLDRELKKATIRAGGSIFNAKEP